MKKISLLALAMLLVCCLVFMSGCDKSADNATPEATEAETVELDTSTIVYTSFFSEPVWKDYKATIGYPKEDNWVAEVDESELVLKDDARHLEVEMKVNQDSQTTWEQNSAYEKEIFTTTDKKWSGGFEGYAYIIGTDTYKGVVVLGHPSVIETGEEGTPINKIEFSIKIKADSEITREELPDIMDNDILANLSWEEID